MQNTQNDQKNDHDLTNKSIDLIIQASWIIPVVPRSRVLEDCAIAIDGDKIIDLGLPTEISARYEARETLNLEGHAIIPGLINSHCHAAMTLLRGYADDKGLMDWLNNYIWPAESKWMSDQFVADGTRLAIAEMLLSGTTCFSDMYFFPEEAATAALDAGIRTQITFPVLDFPTVWGSGPDEYLRKGIALHDQFRSNPLVEVGFGPHAPYTVSDDPIKRIATYAEELQAPVQIHMHETSSEVSDAMRASGVRPLQRIADLGLLSPLTQCVHMTQVTDEDITLLRDSGAHVIHCPESNMKLATGVCPTAKLLENGINVALGTDGTASNNDLDMSGEMQSAALLAKVTTGDANALDAMTALEMATINGARAMGKENQIGSLEVGKQADLIAIDLRDIQHQPIYDVISQLSYTSVGHKVAYSWVNGKNVVRNYELQTLDNRTIQKSVHDWQDKISGK